MHIKIRAIQFHFLDEENVLYFAQRLYLNAYNLNTKRDAILWTTPHSIRMYFKDFPHNKLLLSTRLSFSTTQTSKVSTQTWNKDSNTYLPWSTHCSIAIRNALTQLRTSSFPCPIPNSVQFERNMHAQFKSPGLEIREEFADRFNTTVVRGVTYDAFLPARTDFTTPFSLWYCTLVRRG